MKFKCTNIAILILFIAFFSFQITGCGSSGDDEDSTTPDPNGDTTVVLDKISLATSQVSVKSDNLDFATITATVLDTNNAVVEGATVSFSANEGQISDASVDTDENGKAEITFSSGTDKTNRTATITAQVTGLSPVQIPIQITGTTISLSTDSTNIAVDESPAILTILVQGADGFGAESLVTLSAEPAGVVTLSQYTGNTDNSGNLEVDITGVATGSVTVTVQALGVTATQDYTVGTSDEVFCITSPSEDPYSLSTNINLTITVNAPTQESVQFATTLGTWDWGADLVLTKAVSGGSAEAVLTSSEAGTANVQVFDADDPLVTDSLTVIFSAPSSEASQIALQASATVVPPSTEDATNSVTLTATVKNVTDQVVSNAAVAFSIENPTGGGESIFPVVAYTNENGVANSTFTSGSLSTDNEGVTVKVTVVGTSITDTVNIVIGGTAGSVVIGQSTLIESINDDTAYKLPMSVLVADSNGNPVASATVSLGAWPLQYSTGYWLISDDECIPVITGTYDNEDANRNLIRDADEDTGSSGDPCDGDGQLTPLSSAAGSLPATVTTDENGVANFDLVYLKQYAVWIVEEIRASTLVLGTETTSILEFTLPYLKDDACNLPHSPYGLGEDSGLTVAVSVSADPASIVANGTSTSTITAIAKTDAGEGVWGVEVRFIADNGSITASGITDVYGKATATLTSSTQQGVANVTASVGTISGTTTVTFSDSGASTISVLADPASIVADGTSTSTITATVKTATGQGVPDIKVEFGTDNGSITASGITDTSGKATATLTSSSQQGVANVTASVGSISGATTVTFSDSGASTISVLADPASIVADGTSTSTITATVKTATGQGVPDIKVEFGTDNGSITASGITDTSGKATATLTSSAQQGVANVTASVGTISGTTTVTFSGSGDTAASIKLTADPISVKSDNSDSSIIKATVLDENNAVIEGITVVFSAGGGQISASSADTNANGQAQITFSSGTLDPSNQVVTITGTVSGLSSQVPVQITGSTITLSTDNSNITDDGSTTAALTITAKNAGGTPVYNIPVTLSVSGTGGAILSAYTGNTDSSGKLQVTVSGTNAGSVTVTADGLGTTGVQAYTVSSVGALFGITSPTDDPCPLSTNTDLTIIVNAPALAKIKFATTLGSLTGGGETGQVIEVAVAGGTASAVFRSSQAGLATIQVFDPDDSSTSDTLGVAITAPSVDAARITLQSSAYVVAPSSGGISNTATLTATVRTSDLQVVGGAPVAFSIENPTGGGETVSPVVVYTDAVTGVATTTFTSGSLPSVEPVIVSARVVGEGTTGPLTDLSFNNNDPSDTIGRIAGSFVADSFEAGEQIRVQGSTSNDGIYIIETVAALTLTLDAGETLAAEPAGATVTITAVAVALDPGITIGGTAGSVVIGRGSEITVLSPTTYALPMSVLVADSNGNSVPGAVVSLSAWPAQYSAGTWYDEDSSPAAKNFVPYISGTFDNEDLNENTFLDPGEDKNGDGLLTPHNSAAGTLPATVTTDENGVANFDLVYLKAHANWIKDRIRASTFVLGTETTASTTFRLPYERSEGEAGDLNDSPYPVGLTVGIGGTTVTYTFPVFTGLNDDFTPIYGNITGYIYTYIEIGTGSVGDVIMDYVTIIGEVCDPVTGEPSYIGTIVPVQIIVK